jgi:rSAM/selenodomain-associated transferase 1
MEKIRNSALIIFQKNAVLGKVKSRLAATIGEKRALEVYKDLLMHTHTQIMQLENVDRLIYYSDFVEKSPLEMFALESAEIQRGNDLGERMSDAFQKTFKQGYQKVVIIGTDCPEITTGDLEIAFNSLDDNLVCIGPALDGGYYLIGMSVFIPEVFQNMPWSTDKVLERTIEKLNLLEVGFELLKPLRDIDTEDDLLALFPK